MGVSASVGVICSTRTCNRLLGSGKAKTPGTGSLTRAERSRVRRCKVCGGARVSVAELGRGESRYLDALLPWHDTGCEGITMRACVWRKWAQDGKDGHGECFFTAVGRLFSERLPALVGVARSLEGQRRPRRRREGHVRRGRMLLQLFSSKSAGQPSLPAVLHCC